MRGREIAVCAPSVIGLPLLRSSSLGRVDSAHIPPPLSVAAFGIGIEKGERERGRNAQMGLLRRQTEGKRGGGRKDKRRKALSEKLAKEKSRGCTEKQKGFDRS